MWWLKLSFLEFVVFLFLPNTISIDERVINGTVATSATYTVSIRNRSHDYQSFGSAHFCGGSLIKWNVVLSAAHCFIRTNMDRTIFRPEISELYVVMGHVNLFTMDDNTIILDIAKLVTHQQYSTMTYVNDIALVFLMQSVPIGHPTVRTISINKVKLPPGTRCELRGWGKMNYGIRAQNLMKVNLSLIGPKTCRDARIKGQICAGYAQEGDGGSCSGDSGGPLVCNNVVAGIVSTGSRDCDTRAYGVLMDVAFYSSWIDEHLNNKLREDLKKIENIENIEKNAASRPEDHFPAILFTAGNLILRIYAISFCL